MESNIKHIVYQTQVPYLTLNNIVSYYTVLPCRNIALKFKATLIFIIYFFIFVYSFIESFNKNNLSFV